MKQVPPFLLQLRAATDPVHKALESLTEGDKLLKGQPQKAHYIRLIHTHYHFHQIISTHIKAISGSLEHAILDWPDCNRIPALAKDIATLGLEVKPTQHNNLIRTPEEIYGLCYVSEGSCLGNQMMYNQLKQDPTFQSWQADAFFKSCGEGFGVRWRHFLALLETQASTYYTEIETGALKGFALFKDIWTWHITQ